MADIGEQSGNIMLGVMGLLLSVVGAFIAWMFRMERRQTKTDTYQKADHDALGQLRAEFDRYRAEHKMEMDAALADYKIEQRENEKRIRKIERHVDRHDVTDDRGLSRQDLEGQN